MAQQSEGSDKTPLMQSQSVRQLVSLERLPRQFKKACRIKGAVAR